MAFKPKKTQAVRQKVRASIQIEGLSGSGKSGVALEIALALNKGDFTKFAAIDAENKSLNLYEGLMMTSGIKMKPFDVYQLSQEEGFAPTNYKACMEDAKQDGKTTIIHDSFTHAWTRTGGVLDIVSTLKDTRYAKGNQFAVWNDPEVVSEKNTLFDIVRDDDLHVISTVRLKEKHEIVNQDGKTQVKSLGDQQIMIDDLKYEFDLVLHCFRQGSTKGGVTQYAKVRVIKSRYAIFVEGEEYEVTPKLLEQLREYLDEGADPAVIEEEQRKDYIDALRTIITSSAQKKSIAEVIKEDAGMADVKYSDLPLHILKRIYATINS